VLLDSAGGRGIAVLKNVNNVHEVRSCVTKQIKRIEDKGFVLVSSNHFRAAEPGSIELSGAGPSNAPNQKQGILVVIESTAM
jgi:hypothetical protein